MPRLHRANTLACGRLRWGSCLDTVAVHCDTRSEQVIVCLRYLFMMLVSLSITGLASLFLLLVRFLSCQKTYPCKTLLANDTPHRMGIMPRPDLANEVPMPASQSWSDMSCHEAFASGRHRCVPG